METSTKSPAIAPNGDVNSILSLTEFVEQLIQATKGLIYPIQAIQHEQEDPALTLEVIKSGFTNRVKNAAAVSIDNLDNVIGRLTSFDEDDQQTGNQQRYEQAIAWKTLYDLIRYNAVPTIWHYAVKRKSYTHEMLIVMLHPQGTVAIRMKLVQPIEIIPPMKN